MQTEVLFYSRATAPPTLLSRCMSAYIAVVASSVTLAERAELRRRGFAVFEIDLAQQAECSEAVGQHRAASIYSRKQVQA